MTPPTYHVLQTADSGVLKLFLFVPETETFSTEQMTIAWCDMKPAPNQIFVQDGVTYNTSDYATVHPAVGSHNEQLQHQTSGFENKSAIDRDYTECEDDLLGVDTFDPPAGFSDSSEQAQRREQNPPTKPQSSDDRQAQITRIIALQALTGRRNALLKIYVELSTQLKKFTDHFEGALVKHVGLNSLQVLTVLESFQEAVCRLDAIADKAT